MVPYASAVIYITRKSPWSRGNGSIPVGFLWWAALRRSSVTWCLDVRILESRKCCRSVHCWVTSSPNPQQWRKFRTALYIHSSRGTAGLCFLSSVQQCNIHRAWS
jgi:hypothetical protein